MPFNESLHKRGTGAQGGQFVASDGTKSSAIGYDGKRGSGYGSAGGDGNVKKLQQALNKLGFKDAQGNALKVDGKFGPRTTAAVQRLQRKLGLPADGKITPALLKRIQGLKKTTTYSDAKKAPAKAAAKKAVPARKGAPAKKTPPPAKRVTPEKPNVATKKAPAVRRSVGYSSGMTDIDRHGTHNQKSHGNRLGKPSNVGGKTGLAKATSALADKPEQGPERAPRARNLDTSAKRKAATEEHNKLTKSQFDALPDGEKERILTELRQVVKDSEYDTATGRGSYGMRYRGQAEHRNQAKFMIANFQRTVAPAADNSVGGRAARLKSATTASEARSILQSVTVKDMDAIAAVNGWLGGTSSGWKKEKWVAHLVSKATAGKA